MKTISATLVAWALSAGVTCAEPEAKKPANAKAPQQVKEMGTGAAAYDFFKEPYRSQFVNDWQEELRQWERQVEGQKKDMARKPPPNIRPADPQRAAKREQAQLSKYEKHVQQLRKNQPPYFRCLPYDPTEWRVGDCGRMGGSVIDVIQVIDEGRMLAGVRTRGLTPKTTMMFSGFSMSGFTDSDKNVNVPGLVKVTGTTRYNTAIGGTNTVLLIQPLDLDTIKASDQEIAARRAKREAEAVRKAAEEAAQQAAIEAAKWRTWTPADGEHKVEAKFVKLVLGTLTLEKKDGTTVDVKLDILCPEDKEYLEGLKR